jgi:nucleoside-diphosphate-sugar epimerase
VLVTGATGFIGRHLTAALRESGAEVVAATRTAQQAPGVESLQFDLARPECVLPQQLQGFDCVYHLAARVHAMHVSSDDEAQFRQLNVHATQVLAQTAASAGVRTFVYLSSIKVNGERTLDRPFTADDAPAPQDAYGRSKWQAEQALREIEAQSGLRVVIVRPPLVYGPGVGANFRRMLALVESGWPLPFKSVNNRRSLVNVWNLTSLLLHVRSCDCAAGRTWLVSDDDDVSTPRLMSLIGSALGKRRVRLFAMPVAGLQTLGMLAGRRNEVARLVESLQLDTSATQAALQWRATTGVEEAVVRTVAWFRGERRAMG